jgi:glycosyltransferase involved in cell wall biosynthesis
MAPHCDKPSHLFCHVLSIDPLIIIGLGNLGPFSPALQLCEPLKDHRTYFILGSSWDLDDMTEFTKTVHRYQEFKLAYPRHDFVYMTNAENHAKNLRSFGVPAFFCHHNALIDERIYRIREVQKSYDAIYNARLDPFKRHFLAKHIPSLALVYYNMSGNDGHKYRDFIFKLLPQAIPLNDATGTYKFLNHDTICRFVNRAHVGLVLSAVEGGNHASVEYLLSGVPVVSTTNSGGRNHFLTPEVSRIVEPCPRRVSDAVEELKSLAIPAETIRRLTLKRCASHRITLQGMVQSIFDHEGANRKFSDEWDTVYFNKMCHWGITDWQVVDYVKKWLGKTDKVIEPLRRDFTWEREMKQQMSCAA